MTLPLPVDYPPMEAKLVGALPEGAQWQYEPKWDGFRCLAFRDGDTVDLRSKSGQPFNRYFPEIVAAVGALGARKAVLDGEIVVPVGDVLAFDDSGNALWNAKVGSEVIAPPRVAEGVALVFSGDGRLYALSTKDGATRWVYQRANPPLVVRNHAGAVIVRGAVFFGTAGGRLVGLDLRTGAVGWEVLVATPKGATELERIADVTSLPAIDDRMACASAYQGRTACFELVRGTTVWSRDIGSLGGVAIDSRHLYVTDDAGAVHALDRSTGASVWKQDKLAKRFPGGPQLVGDQVGVVDAEGWLHLLSRENGAYVGRVATDGSAPTSQPVATIGGALWQSTAGALVAVRVR